MADAETDFGFTVVSNGPRRVTADALGRAAAAVRFGLTDNVTMFRQDMFQKLFDRRRNVEDECGYWPWDTDPNVEAFRQLYDRDPVANRAVSLLPKECWQVTPAVYETEDPTELTGFERAWYDLETNLAGGSSYHDVEEGGSVWEMLYTADVLSRIGHFGVLLLGLDDGKNLQEPVDGVVTTNYRVEPVRDPADPSRVTAARVVVTANAGNAPWPDSYLSESEERDILGSTPSNGVANGADGNGGTTAVASKLGRHSFDPRFDNGPGKAPGRWTFREVPLSADERATVNSWRAHREMVLNGGNPYRPVAPVKNDAWGSQYGNKQNPGTDSQYAWQGASPPASLSGTDQQYFGVQFGPSEELTSPDPGEGKQGRKLLWLRAFDESLVQVVRYEWNVRNPRFGMPSMYRVTLNDPREQHSGVGLPMATVFVHWSRIVHVCDRNSNPCSSMVFAPPVLRPVMDRLYDLRKVYGASAEGYWKSCFSWLSFETNPQLGGDVDVNGDLLREQFEQAQNGLQRAFVTSGMTLKTLPPSVVEPTGFKDAILEAICVQIGVPLRVFKGAERGELASSQDDASWNDRVRHRQNVYLTPRLVVPFVDRLIQLGVLPVPDGKMVDDPADEGDAPDRPPGMLTGPHPNIQPDSPEASAGKDVGGPPTGKAAPPGIGKPNSAGGLTGNRARNGHAWRTFNAVLPDNPQGDTSGGGPDDDPNAVPKAGSSAKGNGGKDGGGKETGGYTVKWPDLDSLGDKDKATVAQLKTAALAAYVQSGAEAAVPVEQFLVRFLGFLEEEAKEMTGAAHEQQQAEEEKQNDAAQQQADLAGQHGMVPKLPGFQPKPLPPVVAAPKPGVPGQPVPGGPPKPAQAAAQPPQPKPGA